MEHKKIVLVTGSSSGIGKSIAEYFLAHQYQVIFHGIDQTVYQTAESASLKFNTSCAAYEADLADTTQIDKMIDQILNTHKGIDILVNNAGMQHVCPVEDFSLDKWNKILAVNLTAPFYLSQKVWSYMKKQQFGRIINLSSVHGLRASEYKSAYVSSKHGLNGLTKVLALEGAKYGITVNAICPGYVHTALVDGQIEDQAKAHQLSKAEVIEKVILEKQPIKKFISTETISSMVYFLAQKHAETISGSEIVLDAGWTAK